jgi:hypothetical protein
MRARRLIGIASPLQGPTFADAKSHLFPLRGRELLERGMASELLLRPFVQVACPDSGAPLNVAPGPPHLWTVLSHLFPHPLSLSRSPMFLYLGPLTLDPQQQQQDQQQQDQQQQ